MAARSSWWHDLTIVAIAQAVLLNGVAIVGLLVAERVAALMIDGHTPVWGLVGNVCYAVGLAATEVLAAVILVRVSNSD
jgi:hypothetical protein